MIGRFVALSCQPGVYGIAFSGLWVFTCWRKYWHSAAVSR